MNNLSKRPNFLFFITDQQRADWLGCMGHPVVRTPNIDAIAAQGVRFENFHVASPVCMPNRASLLTGRFPSVHGLRQNGCRLPLSANTFVDVLAAGGYRTATIGKSHLQPFTGLPPWRPETEIGRLVSEAWKPMDGNYAQEEPESYQSEGRYDIDTPYYGYQHVDMITAHGDRCGGHYQQWFRDQRPDWEALHDDANELPHDYTCPQAYRTPIPEELYPTSWVADQAVEYISSNNNDDTPFFTFVSFPDPHHPFNPPGKYWDMYSPDEFELEVPYDAHKNPTPPLKWLEQNWRDGSKPMTKQTAQRLSDQQIKEAMALTAGMITCVDDAIGRVIDALKASGQFENTVICFNSDHGDYLGQFNLLLKGLLPFRSINRVPFIWSDPAHRKEAVSDSMVSTVDLSATILDRAGLEPYRGIQGKSFRPTIDNGAEHRDDLLVEFNDGAAKFGFSKPARVRSVISKRWRFSLYLDEDWGELYDLKNDPNETQNLWDDADHAQVRSELSMRLNHHLTAQMDESPAADRLA
ncbi:MAG: arylsulfatase A-like enzyme [Granulosicoccus sp.]|jgi:arylsulfatase A-like enzyme